MTNTSMTPDPIREALSEERAAFGDRAKALGWPCDHREGETVYRNSGTQMAWYGWQERAALARPVDQPDESTAPAPMSRADLVRHLHHVGSTKWSIGVAEQAAAMLVADGERPVNQGAAVAEGWKLVPTTYTHNVLVAIRKAIEAGESNGVIWANAVEAAPTLPLEMADSGYDAGFCNGQKSGYLHGYRDAKQELSAAVVPDPSAAGARELGLRDEWNLMNELRGAAPQLPSVDQGADARDAAIEECIRFIEGGSFLHDTAPPKLFARELVQAMRERFAAPQPQGYCPKCGGAGSIHTGIDEAPTTLCEVCDGTGLAAPQPSGEKS